MNELYSIMQESYGSGESYCDGVEENPNNKIKNISKGDSAEDALANAKKNRSKNRLTRCA